MELPAKQFSSLPVAHNTFLSNIVRRSFIHITVVRGAIDRICDVCNRFCALVLRYEADIFRVPLDAVSPLEKEFDLATNLLTSLLRPLPSSSAIMSRLVSVGGSKH